LRPWIRWTEMANGVKSGQTPAPPRLKAAKNAGHTLSAMLLDKPPHCRLEFRYENIH
jgi:hypothetical protein